MKTIINIFTLLSLIFVLGAQSAQASSYGPEQKRFGVGLVAGEPTGFTAKWYFAESLAIDGIASWSFVDESFTLISDVTWDIVELDVNTNEVSVPVYIGAGALLGFDQGGKNDGKTLFGVRVPVGIAAQWENHPFEVFLEVAPGIGFAPSTDFHMTGGIGARFFF